MRRKCFSFQLILFGFVCVMVALSSCISTKNVTYFNNLPDSSIITLEKIRPPQPLIQVNDELEIKIGGENEKTVDYISQHFTGGNAGPTVVDIDGNIELPKIGKLKVAGLTRDAAKDTITNAFREYLVDPIVSVKFGGFQFSVLGEVGSPGTFNLTNEKISIFEAIAKAGDLTQYSERKSVKIIRDINGDRKIITLDLNDSKLLNSQDYYLTRYDVVYVAPRSLKVVGENLQRTSTYIASVASVLAFVFLIFKK